MLTPIALSYLPRSLSSAVADLKSLEQPPHWELVKEVLAKKLHESSTHRIAVDSLGPLLDKIHENAERSLDSMFKAGIRQTHYWDKIHYPSRLRRLESPVWCLYHAGKLPGDCSTVSIVGTRSPNAYGTEIIHHVVSGMQTRPLQVISGLAYGVDAIAHAKACSLAIPNFAVLGGGLDELYPKEHQSLASLILEHNGGILSEYPAGTKPLNRHFPIRNRIIAALSDVLWIPQGTLKSGSYHTVKHANDLSIPMAVTPGDIFSEHSALPHKLLRDGAELVLDGRDLDVLLERMRVKSGSLL